MRTLEDLEREIARLNQDLSFARDDASQQALRFAEAKTTLRDQFAMAVVTGLISAARSAEDIQIFTGEGAKVVWQVTDALLKSR